MASVPQDLNRLLLLLLVVGLAACQRTETSRANTDRGRSVTVIESAPPRSKTAKTASSDTSAPRTVQAASSTTAATPQRKPETSTRPKGQVAYSATHDKEISQIVDLTKRNKWEEAEARASALYALDPKDASVQRVYKWVETEGPKRREKALEDEIRDVSTRDTRFTPTVKSILTEKKSAGLPPRTDLREAIEKIKATPYIPDNYGKTIQSKGAFEDFRAQQGRMSKLLDKEITVHLDNVPLETIIFTVGRAEGINFVADKSIPALQDKLSVNFTNVKLVEFLDYLQGLKGVQFQVGDNLIWVTNANDPSKARKEIRFFPLRRGFVIPAQFGLTDPERKSTTANNVTTVTETQKLENFVRDGAPKQLSIETAITNFFTTNQLDYQIDYERNVIAARGTEDQLRLLQKIIDAMDKPIQQVLIEARFITVTESTFMQLGVAWETGRNPLTTGRVPTDFTGLAPATVGAGLENSWFGILGRKSLSATLTAIEQSGESETLSAPRLAVANNLPAMMEDGLNQYYYEQYTVNTVPTAQTVASSVLPEGKPTKVTAGVRLNVLASIGGDGRTINLALNPEVSEDVKMVTFATVVDRDDQGRVASSFDIKLPQIRKQSLATRATVKSGQTVVLGGVLQRTQSHFVESVPVLSRIPLIGAAFRRRTEIDNPRYLLVFVTATILAETGEFVVSADAE